MLVIVSGALLGHVLLSAVFALQAGFCRWSGQCLALGFDPNVYRVILTNGRSAGTLSDGAFLSWFVSLLLPALIVGLVAYRASAWRWVRDLRESASFGWLKRWVDLARPANSFIIAETKIVSG